MQYDAASSSEGPSPRRVHSALLIVSVLFGVNYVVAKYALREISPLALVFVRTSGTTILLFIAYALMSPRASRPAFTRREYGELFFYSLLGTTINQICFLEGLSRSTATNAAVMYMTVPLLTLGFAVLLGRERPSARGVAGVVIGLAGALLLVIPRGHVDFSADTTIGNGILLFGGASYALYLVLTKPILSRHDPLRVTAWVFLFSGLTTLPIGLGGVMNVAATGLTGIGWASVIYVVVGATTLPYLLNNWALVRVTASVVAVYIFVQPIVAGTLGRLLLSEAFGPNTAVAALLVVTGVMLSARRQRA